jgi:hypothetical protein
VNFTDTLIPSAWFRWKYSDPLHRIVHLALISSCDADGLCRIQSEPLSVACATDRRAVVSAVQQLCTEGRLSLYHVEGSHYAWLPHGGGAFKIVKGGKSAGQDLSIPAPSREQVIECIRRLWGRSPTLAEAKSACPRAFGLKMKAVQSDAPSSQEVQEVFDAWRQRQKRPNACRLGNASRRLIKSALSEADAASIILLFKYAYEADEPGPRFWRGENARQATYLGLDNLLRLTKLAGRIQLAMEWGKVCRERATEGDGTNYGPMAAYRASRGRTGPPGTTSESPDGEPRLSAQCDRILQLFLERGADGVRTSELAEVARKYTGRISELRGVGADIAIVERDSGGNNLYVMHNADSFRSGEDANVMD